MLKYGTVTMEFYKKIAADTCDHAVLTTDKGERVYLPRSFIEAAQSGWDSDCTVLDDPGDIYCKLMALDVV